MRIFLAMVALFLPALVNVEAADFKEIPLGDLKAVERHFKADPSECKAQLKRLGDSWACDVLNLGAAESDHQVTESYLNHSGTACMAGLHVTKTGYFVGVSTPAQDPKSIAACVDEAFAKEQWAKYDLRVVVYTLK